MRNIGRHASRVIVVLIALLFLAIALLPLYQLWQDHNAKKTAANNSQNTSKLIGTKLANFTPTSQPQAGLQIIDTKVGDGAAVKPGDSILVDYTGALMSNGTIFDAAADHGGPTTVSLREVIAGWSQGIPGMKVGGTRRLLIPAALGYGSQPQSGIPPNSDLVFDITLLSISQQ